MWPKGLVIHGCRMKNIKRLLIDGGGFAYNEVSHYKLGGGVYFLLTSPRSRKIWAYYSSDQGSQQDKVGGGTAFVYGRQVFVRSLTPETYCSIAT